MGQKGNVIHQSSVMNKRKRTSVDTFQPHHVNDSTSFPTKISKECSRTTSMACKFCENKVSSNFNRHILLTHDKIRWFNCEKCSYSALTSHHLYNHNLGVHDNIRDFKCDNAPILLLSMEP